MPRFSIILPTYNRAHLLGQSIRSIVNQNFFDWELLVVDDGSTDNTKEVVASFIQQQPAIKYIYQLNQERSAARNAGMAKATGNFICFIDSDDYWHPNHLTLLNQKIIDKGQAPALYFTGMRWQFSDHYQDILFESPEGKNPVEYVIRNQIAPTSACIAAEIAHKMKFDTSLRINEDVEFFARIAAQYPVIQIPEVTINLNIHDQNTKGLTKDYISPQIEAMQKIFNDPALRNKISAKFKQQTFKSLRHQQINAYYHLGQYGDMNKAIARFLLCYPLDAANKPRVVLLLYHLPGGRLLQLLVQKLKKK